MNLIDKQHFSDKTLKGFLLKNVESASTNPAVKSLNAFCIARVDHFWDTVVVPLRAVDKFDGNKINWYYEIYKEGYEARKMALHPFSFVNISMETSEKILAMFKDKTLAQYLELGTSYLSDCYFLLSAWHRDQLLLKRLVNIYSSDKPVDWILKAEIEEKGIMKENVDTMVGVSDILNNIRLLMVKKI